MKKKRRITEKSISIMGGICFILFAIVTLFSTKTPFSFLYKLIGHSFGFIGFWLFLPYIVVIGLYLIMNQQVIKIKLGIQLWGVLVIIFCFLILSSHWASWGTVIDGVEIVGFGRTEIGTARYLTYSNSLAVFDKVDAANPSLVGPNPKLGGGRVGFLLAGALNSAVTPLGLNIVCWILFVMGLAMIFHRQVHKFLDFIKTPRTKEKGKSFKEVNLTIDEIEPDQPIRVEDVSVEEFDPNESRATFDSFQAAPPINNDYSLKKARFIMNEDGTQVKEIYEEELSKPVFESPKQAYFEENSEETKEENVSPISFESTEKEYKEPFFEPLNDAEKEEEFGNSFENELSKPQIQVQPMAAQAPQVEEVDFLHKPQPKANLIKNYIYPSIELLDVGKASDTADANEASCQERTEIINKSLANYKVGAQVVSHIVGPSVTRFDLQTNDDVSVTSVQKYITDLQVRLGGVMMRFEPIVSGKSTSGLEIPNEFRTNVTLREAVAALPFDPKHKLLIPFGKSISGDVVFADLADFPHMLVAGTTGSGKSIFVHATIISLIMRCKPEELKLVMVDPKKVEMNYYENIPHLLCPVISDVGKVLLTFNKLVDEMERRYILFQTNRVRDIKGFNEFAKLKDLQPLPYIVVFIDEYADLIETCKELRTPVVRIVQKARAAGIHLVIATQRPSVNVIDGVIKANVATRVALMCASTTDSMTVIGEGGAEKLLGNGDMLIDCPIISRAMKPRVQGCYVSETEIMRVCDYLREHYQPQYDPVFMNLKPVVEEKSFDEAEPQKIDKAQTDEEAYQKIKEDATHREYFSISYITRTYGMGYSRAGKMFTRLQKEGIVAPSGDARGCKVLVYVPGGQSMGTPEQSTFIPDDDEFDN
ncbi:MAG: hypothetical protein IKP50_03115 [Bacilli bacterium]|nr:hypothetical protein [Bacilli bacterium]